MVCVLVMTVSPAKMDEPIEMSFEGDSHGPNKSLDKVQCTLTPPGEYDGPICMAATIQAVVTITAETCLLLQCLKILSAVI